MIQALGASPARLGSVHSGSKGRILSMGRTCFDLACPVAEEMATSLSISVNFLCGVWLLSSRKLTQPMVLTIVQAQVDCLPRKRGDGRLRASTPASLRHSAPYSAFRLSRQNPSVKDTMAS